MFRWAKQTGRDPEKVVRASDQTFHAPLRWQEPKLVFTLSLGDFFHPDVDAFRDEIWEVIRRCPQHIFQILTKRPERILSHLPQTCFNCGEHGESCACGKMTTWFDRSGVTDPWPNVWLGTSVENQRRAEERIPHLVAVPAVVHFLSCEPLLGPIDFGTFYDTQWGGRNNLLMDIEWVITGGESDYKNPRLHPSLQQWFVAIRDQCELAGVRYFHKQNGGTSKCKCHGAWGCRSLEGQTYDGMPAVLEEYENIDLAAHTF